MARPRRFDPDVLGAALELFWAKGYRATSFDDITCVTGITGVTTSQMQDPASYASTYAGWDFANVW